MRYVILSIDDSRKKYTDSIRRQLCDWEEVKVDCVNGNDKDQLDSAIEEFGVTIGPERKVGQIGCTLSTLRALSADNEPVLILNDDALLSENFSEEFSRRLSTLPEYDVFSAFIPRDHDWYFYSGVTLKDRITNLENQHYSNGHPMFQSNGTTCRAYMRYGGVALYFTPNGKDKYLSMRHLEKQMDDALYLANYHHTMKVYTSVPHLPDLAYITGTEDSICQNTRLYYE